MKYLYLIPLWIVLLPLILVFLCVWQFLKKYEDSADRFIEEQSLLHDIHE